MNLCTRERPDLQSGAINRSATPPLRLQKREFYLVCQVCNEYLMKKPGKPPRARLAKPSSRPFRDERRPKSDDRNRSSSRTDRKPEGKSAPKRDGKPARGDFKGKSEFRAAPERSQSRDRPQRDFGEKRETRSNPPSRTKNNRPDSRPARIETRADSRPARDSRPPREPKSREPKSSLGPRANMFGLHAVREAWLNPKRSIHAVYLSEGTEALFASVFEQADRKGLERPDPKILSKEEFERLLGRDVVHQGAALSAAPLEESFVQDIISIGAGKERSIILMLDQVTDPHNVGAIVRSACAFGADGVLMQRRHAPELDGIVAKTASGAAEHIAVAYETNLSRTLEELTEAGYMIIGLDEHSDKTLSDLAVPDKAVLILGAEGDGMRRLIKEHCDVLVTLPTQAPIASLNVSNAAAVALYALIKG